MKSLWTMLLLAAEVIGGLDDNMSKYHSHSEMTDILKSLNRTYYNLTNMYSIGESSKGKELWVLEIAAGETKGLVRPNMKLIGNIHGNEPVGKELLLKLAKYLVEMYNVDPQVTRLLNFARVHLLPSLNPDGFELAMATNIPGETADCVSGPGRANYHNFDLNRNFPDHFEPNDVPYQSETLAIKNWLERIPFILSASLHGGALLASYPYDNRKQNEHGDNVAHLTPDDDVFKHLASTYANAHPTMHNGITCPGTNVAFPNGITNGAAWYKVKGGMQDFNYIDHGCMELTLEVSCCKLPKAEELPQYWEDNKKALLSFLNEIHRVLRGIVRDEAGDPVVNATVKILGRDVPFHTNSNGEFWRILLPHVYILEITATGFHTVTTPIKVRDPDPTKWSQLIKITLHRIGSKLVLSNPITWSNASSISEENEIPGNTPRRTTEDVSTEEDVNIALNTSTEVIVNNTPNILEVSSTGSSSTFKMDSRWLCINCIIVLSRFLCIFNK